MGLALIWYGRGVLADASVAPDFAQLAFVGSDRCVDCHQDRHASWQRTFHRTITQQADAHSVQGQFDGRALEYGGVRVLPTSAEGQFWFEYRRLEDNQLLSRIPVIRTVGSHRYQQYLTQDPVGEGTYYRLHYLWHNQDQGWVRVNNAFLHGDGMHLGVNAFWICVALSALAMAMVQLSLRMRGPDSSD